MIRRIEPKLLNNYTWIYLPLAFLFITKITIAQDPNLDEKIRIEILESRVKYFYGTEKIDALIDLTSYYSSSNSRKAIRYGRQAVSLSEEIYIDNNRLKQDTLNYVAESNLQLGKAYFNNSKYLDAKESLDQAKKWAEESMYQVGITESDFYLDKIDSLVQSGYELKRGFLSQSLKSLELKEKISKTTLDWNINQKINTAQGHLSRYEYEEAIKDYSDAINLLKNKGDQEQIEIINSKIAEIRKMMNVDEDVVKNYNDAIEEQERIIEELAKKPLVKDTTLVQHEESSTPANVTEILNIDKLEMTSDSLNLLANTYYERKDYARAETYRLLHEQVEDEIKKREGAETQLKLLRQQKQLAEMDLQTKNLQLQAQKKARYYLIFGIALMVALAIALLMLYITKQRDHKKLGHAYGVLEETKSKLTVAEGNIKKLLRQQVSEDIAKELMAGGATLSTKRSFVCIMFLDIRGFTPWAEKHTAEEIIDYQNKIFGFMIDIVNEYKGNINQFLGDGFMATFGAPKPGGNDCQNALDAALKIMNRLEEEKNDQDILNTKIGIGLHAGYVVTGNVGTDLRKQYSITGNTVILASRIEQLNKEFNSRLVISKDVFAKLDHYPGETDYKTVKVKGRNTPIEILTLV